MRTVLSLLGVTVGIFAIISVFTLVDSLERSIKDSMSFVGDKVVRVEKWPWSFQPNYPWWKYFRRPQASYDEYEFLEENLINHQGMTIMSEKGGIDLKYKSSSFRSDLKGVSYTYKDVFEVPVESGRYFSLQEVEKARQVALIGGDVAKTLFPNEEAVGKFIKIKGLKYKVIGVLKLQGDDLLNASDADMQCLIPYKAFARFYNLEYIFGSGSTIAIKGLEEDEGQKELMMEITSLMRRERGLRPEEEDNFAVNRAEMVADMISSTFDSISVAGWVIGGFSILVGGFGIANIMFVSVRERTNIIGIQKSLGAKNHFILSQFLFEAIFLSLIGGFGGLLVVYLLSFIPLGSLDLVLSLENVILGVTVSSVVGLISGIIPAYMAARLDPVIAIRTN
jgi:putative ABC transport system permease protein